MAIGKKQQAQRRKRQLEARRSRRGLVEERRLESIRLEAAFAELAEYVREREAEVPAELKESWGELVPAELIEQWTEELPEDLLEQLAEAVAGRRLVVGDRRRVGEG